MNDKSIRILLVDDSDIALKLIARILNNQPGVEVVGEAKNGVEAMNLLSQVNPTIICTDYFMPKMGGLQLVKHVMATNPIPILVVSSYLNIHTQRNLNAIEAEDVSATQEVFDILRAGALDCTGKPTAISDAETVKIFIEKISSLSNIYKLAKQYNTNIPATLSSDISIKQSVHVISIGSSTGGLPFLCSILEKLPSDYPIPIVCFQYMSLGLLSGFVSGLQELCKLNISIATPHETLVPRKVYFPPEESHLLVNQQKQFVISPVNPSEKKYSISLLMRSVAQYYKDHAVGILLAGTGEDGASGMAAIKEGKGITIAQSKAPYVIDEMPGNAIEKGAVDYVMDPDEIVQFLLKLALQ